MKHYGRSIFILLALIFLMSCNNFGTGKERESYAIQIQNNKYRILINRSLMIGPYLDRARNLHFYVFNVAWQVENTSKTQESFFWDQIYLIDSQGIIYNAIKGENTDGEQTIGSGNNITGYSVFQVEALSGVYNMKCGITGANNAILIRLQPEIIKPPE